KAKTAYDMIWCLEFRRVLFRSSSPGRNRPISNGIRINGQRVEIGRLRPGDELSIAHIRYRLEGEADSSQASEPAISEQDSSSDRSEERRVGKRCMRRRAAAPYR